MCTLELWRDMWGEAAMSRQLIGTIINTVRVGKVMTYIDTHKLYESVWYGHELVYRHTHHTSILGRPWEDVWDT